MVVVYANMLWKELLQGKLVQHMDITLRGACDNEEI
jgi:hypothetical protein